MKLCLQLEDSGARAIDGHNRLLVFLEASDNNRRSVTNWGKAGLGWRPARPTTAYHVSQRIDTIR